MPASKSIRAKATSKRIFPADSKELESKPVAVIRIPSRIRSKTSGTLVLSKIALKKWAINMINPIDSITISTETA